MLNYYCNIYAIFAMFLLHIIYTMSGKKVYSILGITSSNTGLFSKFFNFQNLLEICNKAVVKYPTTSQMCHYATL